MIQQILTSIGEGIDQVLCVLEFLACGPSELPA